jgi:hypothetical protein
MGDMAEMYADMWMDGCEWDDDVGWFNPFGGRVNKNIKCKYCGRMGFHWKQTEQGWRLFTDNGRVHACKKYKQPELFKGEIMPKIHGKPLKVKFNLSLSRVTSSTDDGFFRLTVEDAASRTIVAEVDIGLEKFADLMSSRLVNDCSGLYYSGKHVGEIAEHSAVQLKVSACTKEEINRACDEFLKNDTEGWLISDYERQVNHHKYADGTYKIGLYKYTKVEK